MKPTKKLKIKFRKLYRKVKRKIKYVLKKYDFTLVISGFLSLICLFLIIFIFKSEVWDKRNKNAFDDIIEHTKEVIATNLDPQAASTMELTTELVTEAEPTMEELCQEIYDNNKDLLILVNRDNELPDNYTFTEHTLNSGYIVDDRAYEDLKQMLTDCLEAGYDYTIISAYRSRELQEGIVQKNVNNYIAMGYSEEEAYNETYKTVQKPGFSEHETGLSLDITAAGVYSLTEYVADDPTNIWLMENCHKYGFVLRYDEDKSDITGIDYEPWHFRYVGKEAALFLTENDLCLEEFYMYINK